MLVARREDRLAALAASIQQHYPQAVVHTVVLDVRDLAAIARLPEELPAEFRVGCAVE